MRGLSKKMFISILTSVIVFVTMVATTFAWVGIFTYANTENFSFMHVRVSFHFRSFLLNFRQKRRSDAYQPFSLYYSTRLQAHSSRSLFPVSVCMV